MTMADQMEPLWESHGRQINEAGLRRGSGKPHSIKLFLKSTRRSQFVKLFARNNWSRMIFVID